MFEMMTEPGMPSPGIADPTGWDDLWPDDDAMTVTADDWIWLAGGDPAQPLPVDLETLSPGLAVAATVGLDPGSLSETDRVKLARVLSRAVSHAQARLVETVASIVDAYQVLTPEEPDLALEGAAAELRAALHLTRRSADIETDRAVTLRDRLPQVLEALREGRICHRRSWVLADATTHLSETEARQVCEQALRTASQQTSGQLRALVRKLCAQTDPQQAKTRFEQAHTERRVVMFADETGTATIQTSGLSPDRAQAILDRLTRTAHHLRTDKEQRSIDQLRTDVFCDLLEGDITAGRSGRIEIRADITTLAGLDQQAIELSGYGPITAELGRHAVNMITGNSQWSYVLTHQGRPVDVGPLRHRRYTPAQRRVIQTRNQTCVFPGCRTPATNCDIDHTQPWAQNGETTTNNGDPLCRHDHVIQHRHQWTRQRHPDGTITWTSPLGNQYTRPPPDP